MKPHLVKWHNEYANDGLVIIDINRNSDSLDAIQKSAEDPKLPYAILRDSSGKNVETFGIKAFPMAYLLAPDKNGKFDVVYQGFPGAAVQEIEAKIKEVLPTLNPMPEMGKVGKQADKFLGDDMLKVLRAPDSVRACRIEPFETTQEEHPDAELFENHKMLSKFVKLSAAQVGALQDLIRKDDSYLFGPAKACEFVPGVAVQFTKGKESVSIQLCFSCDEWRFAMNGTGKSEDFDPIRADLVKLAKELFPDDEAIQELK